MPRLILPSPHSREQNTLLHPPTKINVCTAGSKFGKTTGIGAWQAKVAWENPNTISRWVAPIYRQAKIGMRVINRMYPSSLCQMHRADMELHLANGSIIQFASADRPETLEGEGVQFFVVDEAAKMSEEAWQAHLSTISATDGIGWVVSTPKGRNWFHALAQLGIDPSEPDFSFFRFQTSHNPHVRPEVIARARRILPVRVFEQMFLGLFRDETGGVFEGVDACAVLLGAADPIAGMIYQLGADIAKVNDYTVLTVMDSNGNVVAWERFNGLLWGEQVHRIEKLALHYQATIQLDATGIGDPIFDALRERGLRVVPHKFTNQNKRQLIENLKAGMSEGDVRYPRIAILMNELKAFEHSLTKTGEIRYSAPLGSHDDAVISLALAWYGVRGYSPTAEEITIEPQRLYRQRGGGDARRTQHGTS